MRGFSSPWKGFCDHPPLLSSGHNPGGDKTWTEQPTKEQHLKTAAVKAWQSLTMEETQCLVMSLGSRLKAVGASKGSLTKNIEK